MTAEMLLRPLTRVRAGHIDYAKMLDLKSRAMVSSLAIGLVCGWNLTNIGAIAEQMASSYAIGLAAIGLLTTALVLTHTIAQIPGGRLTDRFGAKTIAAGAMSLLLLCNAALMIAPVAVLAFPLRALAGIGTGTGFLAGNAMIRNAGGQALAQGFFGGIGIAASGLAVAVVPQVETLVGWRAPFLTTVILAAAALGLIAMTSSARAPRTATSERRTDSIFRDWGLYRLAIMHGTALLSIVVGAWISTLFVRDLDVSTGTAGLMGGLALLGGLLTRPGSGWLLNRKPALVRITVASSLVAGATGILLIAVAPSVPIALVGAAVLGLAAGVPFAPAFFGAGRLRPDAPASAVGLVNTIGNGFVIVGTPLLGLAFSLTGDGRIGFVAVAGVWLLALVALPRNEDFGIGRTSDTKSGQVAPDFSEPAELGSRAEKGWTA